MGLSERAEPTAGEYLDFERLLALALDGACECDVCEALRASNGVAAHMRRRYRSLWLVVSVTLALVVIGVVVVTVDLLNGG
jgi:hypothetical protein